MGYTRTQENGQAIKVQNCFSQGLMRMWVCNQSVGQTGQSKPAIKFSWIISDFQNMLRCFMFYVKTP